MPAQIAKGERSPKWTIAERMAHYNVVGVSVAVIDNYAIHWAKGYGILGEKFESWPVTTETLFQAGSISKPVAATAALHLVEAGKLSLDEDVNQKLKSWHVPENEFTRDQKVTLRRILSHSAGLTVHGFPGYAVDETDSHDHRNSGREEAREYSAHPSGSCAGHNGTLLRRRLHHHATVVDRRHR